MQFTFAVVSWCLAFLAASLVESTKCKTSPHDANWPSVQEWASLNQSIQGTLLKTIPVSSSCYPGNPFGSSHECSDVKDHWGYAAYHSRWVESNDYSIWNNNSCLPPGVSGYSKEKGCSIGGLPQYIVNATTEKQVATAMKWASDNNIRVVIKSTGHDLNGRSTGAYSLSILTHNFNHIRHQPAWEIPGKNETADVVICGGGNSWGNVYTAVHQIGRTVVGGEDATVGLGGLIQNGGHGLLSSTYGLASDQVYQVTVVTSDGRRLIANDQQNRDLFWAVRGAGGGQFGVITEFILKTHPVPANVVTGGLTFYPRDNFHASGNASWAALAETASNIPDLMDAGITGTVMSMTGDQAVSYAGMSESVSGPAVIVSLASFNSSTKNMNETIHRLVAQAASVGQGNLNISITGPTSQSYWSHTKPNFMSSQSAGATSLFTSRLLGRPELSDIPRERLIRYLQRISVSQDPKQGAMLLFGLQGGPGPSSIPEERRGSVLPAWRSAYAHVMAYGSSFDDSGDPKTGLEIGAKFYENAKEAVWRDWAPNTGSYMNEGNPFTTTWKHDFYGINYDRLLDLKLRYDPSESIYVISGIVSDRWYSDLHSGLLCRVGSE